MAEGQRYGITVLYEPQESSKDQKVFAGTIFDLVAIHGLNGDAIETWTHKQSQVMWLRDLLPKEIPNVRIMTYGYNAKFRNFTGQQDIRSIATKLLTELVDLRITDEEMQRPIVFVCHSLGGIIAKKALLLGVPEELTHVQKSVYGIAFLATPHNGSSIATCGKVIANVVAACTAANPAQLILAALQKDSKVLFEITSDFVSKTSSLQLASFFETRRTDFGLFSKFVRDPDAIITDNYFTSTDRDQVFEHASAVLNVPTEVTIPQNADHRDIARFLSLHDRNFRAVLSRLNKFRQDISKNLNTISQNGSTVLSSKAEDECIIFDTPFSPCNTFQGREDLLSKMNAYFHDSSKNNEGLLIFAICGLGGSGKTQSALQFATRNRQKYRSGVFFLNAGSDTTLSADCSRICDLLQLGSVTNKIYAFKEWLSKDDHSDWLLIFDNADDLNTVRISQYLPQTSHGHVIITTRDQAAIGTVAKDGYILERLEVEEAIAVLFQKAGFHRPSAKEYTEARVIVELLGCLPLAVDQGGAFIKSRHRTLADYHRLYKERQHEILRFKPRLGEYDKTVFTTWEMNFEQVERDSREASDLLLLFCYLDGSQISENMLDRACSSQKRWDRQGEMIDVTPAESGLDLGLVAMIKDEMRFDAAVEKLLSFSLIHLDNDSNGSRNFSLHPLVQHCASQRVALEVQSKWRSQAILLNCHAFPRNKYLEPLYGDLGRIQLPHINRIVREYDEFSKTNLCEAPMKHELASMLLAASRFSTVTWKREAIDRVNNLLQGGSDVYLHAWAAQRESSLFRMMGNEEDSNKTLERFIHSTVLPGYDEKLENDARWNAQRGELLLSFAENLIQTGRLVPARYELLEWEPLNAAEPSTMERILLRSKKIMLGKILKYEGHFQEALSFLEDLLEESEADHFYEGTGWRRVLLSNVGDLYCELARPADAERLVEPELKQMIDRGQQTISSGRRLQLVLAESFLCRGMYAKAMELLQNLKEYYEADINPDVLATRGFFRVRASMARIFHFQGHWKDALASWRQAGKLQEILGRQDGYQSGMVRYGIALALLKLGNVEEGLETYQKAAATMDTKMHRHWIVGFDSYWHDHLIQSMDEAVSSSGMLNPTILPEATKG